MNKVYERLREWLDAGQQGALATLVARKGSAMRGVGARMAVNQKGEMQGSISGGCVEGALVTEALECLRSGQAKLLHYGIADETAWSVGLMCGGEIDVFLQPFTEASKTGFRRILLDELIEKRRTRSAHIHYTVLEGEAAGTNGLLEQVDGEWHGQPPVGAGPEFLGECDSALRIENPHIVAISQAKVFIDVFKPMPRLVIIGAVHLAEGLVRMAHVLGYGCVLIDPRKAFARPEKFPEADEVLQQWPQEGLAHVGLQSDDYLLLLSHDDKIDLPAASAALQKGVGYIGMLASRATRARRSALLQEEGHAQEAIERIHAPVGLDIGAQSPEEIALSILAEITAHRFGKAG